MSVTEPQQVIITDVKMPFVRMVIVIIKWSLAAIPAAIILVALGAIIYVVAGGLFLSPVLTSSRVNVEDSPSIGRMITTVPDESEIGKPSEAAATAIRDIRAMLAAGKPAAAAAAAKHSLMNDRPISAQVDELMQLLNEANRSK